MRYAIVSDLHANMQAWNSVHEDIQDNKVDRIICLGDIVGYGPNPAQILKEIRNKVDAVILGNHDAALCGKLDSTLFNDDAQRMLEWTRKQLTDEDIKYISSFPLTLIGDGFLCAHGEFSEPGNFDYASEPDEVMRSWKANEATLLFAGHTHVPGIFVLGSSGIPRAVGPQDFTIDAGKRYFVNVGSVGQPRNNDLRACYCIYDTESKSLYWRRIAFNVEAYRQALRATGLQLDPSYYLPDPQEISDTASGSRPVVFSPPQSPEKAAHDVVPVQDLKTIPKRKKKIPLGLVSIIFLIFILAGAMIWQKIPHSADIIGTTAIPLAASTRNSLPLPEIIIKPGQAIPGWDIHLKDKNNQQIAINLDPFKQPFLYFSSRKAGKPLALSSSWVTTQAGQAWTFDASFQKKKGFTGDVALGMSLAKTDGTVVTNFILSLIHI